MLTTEHFIDIDIFYSRLDKVIGLPQPDVFEQMRKEHAFEYTSTSGTGKPKQIKALSLSLPPPPLSPRNETTGFPNTDHGSAVLRLSQDSVAAEQQ